MKRAHRHLNHKQTCLTHHKVQEIDRRRTEPGIANISHTKIPKLLISCMKTSHTTPKEIKKKHGRMQIEDHDVQSDDREYFR